jgi:hypothetical protein
MPHQHVHEVMSGNYGLGETFTTRGMAQALADQLNANSRGRRPYWVKTYAAPFVGNGADASLTLRFGA